MSNVFRTMWLLACAVAIASLGPGASAEPLKRLRVVFPPIGDLLPAYVAKDHGIFEKHGLDVELTSVANLGVVTSALVSGQADIGFSVAVTVMQAHNAGIDQVLVAGATAFPLPEGFGGVLARADSGIRQASDLVGRKVAVVGLGAFHHLVLVEWLRSKGVDPSKVNFVEVPFPQQADVLRAGHVDAVVTVDPIYARVINEKIGYTFDDYLRIVDPGSAVDFYVALRSWAEANQATINAFRAALDEGADFVHKNESEARVSMQKWTKQPEAIARIAKIPPFSTEVGPSQMNFWVGLAERQNLLNQPVKSEDFFLNR